MSFSKKRFAMMACASLILMIQPAVVRAETIDDAVQSALTYHPSVDAARAALDVAQEEKAEQFSGYFPELSVVGTGGRMFADNSTSRGLNTTRGEGYSWLWEGNFTARQMIFDGFETSNRVDSAGARKVSANMGLMDLRETLAYAATQSYIDIIRTTAALRLLQGHAAKIDDYMGRIKNMVDEGASDEAEYQQARDIRVVLDGFITDYNGQYEAARARYAEVTGHLPGEEMVMPVPPLDLIPETIDQAVTQAKEEHPAVKTALYTSKSSAYEIDAERAALMPTLDGELSYLKSDKEDVIGGEVRDARALLRMNWALETGGAQMARIKKKKLEHHQSLARVREAQRRVEQGVRLAFSEYETAMRQIENQDKRIALNEKLFDTYEVQFEGARITLLQLMQADNQYFTTKLEKLNGKHRVLAAQYAVLASMGKLQDAFNVKLSAAEPAGDGQR